LFAHRNGVLCGQNLAIPAFMRIGLNTVGLHFDWDKMSDLVSFKEIAARIGVDTTTVRRLIERVGAQLGITIQKSRSKGRNAMWANFLTREDAERLVSHYESRNLPRDENSAPDSFQAFGYFYLIQLVPEALPNRIKVGYTDNLERRLADHQTSAPTAKIIGSWPCKRSWDYAAMDSITREECKLVLNEVFEGDPQGFVDRANAFFAVMPKDEGKHQLSEHSPLNQNK
jgi:T5orf172 domain